MKRATVSILSAVLTAFAAGPFDTGKIDSAAAAFILQGVLDRLQSLAASARTEPDPSNDA